LLVWNNTPSEPVGLYVAILGAPGRGDFVTLEAPSSLRSIISERGYLPPSYRLLKRVVAVAGDRVCTSGGVLVVGRARVSAIARTDCAGRLLPPPFPICGAVPPDHVIVAAPPPSSLDSRYFGPVPLSTLTRVEPLWTR
jgi:conjugative transfer signal peptidase TraF